MSLGQLGTDVQRLLNQLLENAEEMPYSFHLEETEITSNLAASFGKLASQSTEPWMLSGAARIMPSFVGIWRLLGNETTFLNMTREMIWMDFCD